MKKQLVTEDQTTKSKMLNNIQKNVTKNSNKRKTMKKIKQKMRNEWNQIIKKHQNVMYIKMKNQKEEQK